MVQLRLSGELDIAAAAQLRQQLRDALADTGGGGCLLVDLTHLEFLDCSALSVLLDAARSAAPRHIELQLTGERGSVARLLQLTQARRVIARIWARSSN